MRALTDGDHCRTLGRQVSVNVWLEPTLCGGSVAVEYFIVPAVVWPTAEDEEELQWASVPQPLAVHTTVCSTIVLPILLPCMTAHPNEPVCAH